RRAFHRPACGRSARIGDPGHDRIQLPRHAASKCGFGRSGNDRDLGLFLHPTIAIDAADGGMIGLVGAQVLNRTKPKRENPKPRAIEDKESYRWLHAADEGSKVLA